MGDSNSKPLVNEEFLRSFRNDYKQIGEVRDGRLGNVRVFEGPHNLLVAEKNLMATNKEEVERFLSTHLAKALSARSKYLMKLHAYKVHQEDSMCGSISSLSTYHEYYQNTVQDELVRRNQVNLFYLESELWAILYSIVSASSYLEKGKHLPLSDVRPQNIYFTQNGEVKLLPFGIYQDDQTAYQRYFAQNEETLLSPEQLVKIKANAARSDCDQVRADVYAMGQTMLMCACLQTNPSCYNFEDNTINPEFVNQLQDFSKSQYSKFFNNIVNIMLSEKPEDRPTPSTILQILQPFEAEILALKPFNPDYETVKQALAANGTIPVSAPQTASARKEEQTIAKQATQMVAQQPQLSQQQQLQQQQLLQQQLTGSYNAEDPYGQGQQAPMEQFFQYQDQPQMQQSQHEQQPMYVSYAQQPQVSQPVQQQQYSAAPKFYNNQLAQSTVQQQPQYQFQPNQSQVVVQQRAPDFTQQNAISDMFNNHSSYVPQQQSVIYQDPNQGHFNSGYPVQVQQQPQSNFYQQDISQQFANYPNQGVYQQPVRYE